MNKLDHPLLPYAPSHYIDENGELIIKEIEKEQTQQLSGFLIS